MKHKSAAAEDKPTEDDGFITFNFAPLLDPRAPGIISDVIIEIGCNVNGSGQLLEHPLLSAYIDKRGKEANIRFSLFLDAAFFYSMYGLLISHLNNNLSLELGFLLGFLVFINILKEGLMCSAILRGEGSDSRITTILKGFGPFLLMAFGTYFCDWLAAMIAMILIMLIYRVIYYVDLFLSLGRVPNSGVFVVAVKFSGLHLLRVVVMLAVYLLWAYPLADNNLAIYYDRSYLAIVSFMLLLFFKLTVMIAIAHNRSSRGAAKMSSLRNQVIFIAFVDLLTTLLDCPVQRDVKTELKVPIPKHAYEETFISREILLEASRLQQRQ